MLSRLLLCHSSARFALHGFIIAFLMLFGVSDSFANGQPFTLEHNAKLRAVSGAAISPDGRYLAYLLSVPRDPYGGDDGSAWSELHVAGPEKDDSRPFVSGEVNVSRIAWSPDGSRISFVAKRGDDKKNAIYVISIAGGEARKVAQADENITAYSWSPDGKSVAYLAKPKEAEIKEKLRKKGFKAEVYEEDLRNVKVWIADLKETAVAKTKDAEMLDLEGSASELHWSPAGGHLAVALAPTSLIDDHYMKRKVHIVDVESGKSVAQIDNPGKLGAVRWAPDGKRWAMLSAEDLNDPSATRLMVANTDGGTPRDLMPNFEGDFTSLGWQGNDTVMFVAHQGVESWFGKIELEGGEAKTLVATGGPVLGGVSLTRDGNKGAFVANSPAHPGELFVTSHGDSQPARWTNSNPWLADIQLSRQEVVKYKSRDGVEIEGLLMRPRDEQAGLRYPLIVVVHGGPESHYSNGWLTRYSNPGQYAAAEGYAVFYPNYRGSTGRGVKFSKMDQADYAGGEFDDLVDGVDHLVKIGLVDRAKVGVTGGSYGGYASAWCATALSEHFAASVMMVGISDQISKFGTTDIPQEMFLVHARRWPWDYWDWFRDRSPIFHTPNAKTPILILHGKNDTRVHPSQSMELYRYLKVLGKAPVRLVFYPGEGHGNRKAAARYDYGLRMMRWMNHYLKGPGGNPPPYELELDLEKMGLKEKTAETET